ncbi:(21S)-21-acetyl-1-hydroxy-apo-melianone synthase CYP88A164-like [Nicotiana tabacum]|uniref:(21S)-21-acetyl-1-hydroxy-apo-melianone synthase CYP88A164-like n=1 Tax=Nicotiana tabacum TaxID=4097 RepID=A0A1S3WZS9_TOBAC|nr:PREDICTED: beta-amyrin 11-oxidase-like [Nicotiana tabacum]
MEYYNLAFFYTILAVGILTLYSLLKRANGWYYSIKFSSKKYIIPPGEMGWPFIGNTFFFFSFAGDHGSFLSYFSTRFGPGGMYKAHIFGKPSIIITKPETIRKILMDEENIDRGMPEYISKLAGITNSIEEDKRIRRSIAPIKSHGLLSDYFDCINDVVRTTFDKYAATEESFEFLTEMRKPTFEVFMRILIGGEVAKELFDAVFKENNLLMSGAHSLPINIPGFAYNKAIKARRELVKIFQQILEERKAMIAKDKAMLKSNIIDMMLDTQDDDDNEGKGLSDEKIINMLIFASFGGYEPVALMATKAIMHLEKHPDFLHKAKEEQEDIIQRRPSSNAGLNFDEIRQMKYLSKVINETLRIASSKTIFLKDTNTPYNINGYTIPKGWKFFALLWSIRMDPDIYAKPEEFNPSRWDDLETKPGCFLPFSIGPRMCPGSNLARLQISVILHYFLLYYRLEQLNPDIKTDPPENCLVRFKKISA